MTLRRPVLRLAAVVAAVATLHTGCVFHGLSVNAQPDLAEGHTVTTPVRAHLSDARIALFRNGFTLRDGELRGHGEMYDALLRPQGHITGLSLDEVVAFESYRSQLDGGKTAVFSLLGTAVGVVAGAALAVAAFGSCPTVYSGSGAGERLEAELFSYSIAPLFEGRDMDALAARPDALGKLALEVRNEALETHYINHLALVEVVHEHGERAIPDGEGRVAVVRDLRPVRAATDRAGRDWTAALRRADGLAYESPEAMVRRASAPGGADELFDWVELELDVPGGDGPPALVVTARNSLLITVLFYEMMLARAGAGAIDWMARDLERISTAVRLGRWIGEHSGLHVEVWRDGAWERVARLPDPGPIAWRQAAVELPALPPGPARVRLGFLTDGWRLDAVAVARRGTGRVRTVPPGEILDSTGNAREDVATRVAASDEEYLVTYPGQHLTARFDVGPGPARGERSFLLSSQGHYTEWVRAEWLRRAGPGTPFEPTREALQASLRRWTEVRSDFERDFRESRVPVR